MSSAWSVQLTKTGSAGTLSQATYAVVDGEFLPLSDPRALVALTDSALLTGLGYSEKAAEYQN